MNGPIRAMNDPLRSLAEAFPEFYEAPDVITERYAGLVNCGDCGSWDPETEDPVIKARAVLKRMKGESGSASLEGKMP